MSVIIMIILLVIGLLAFVSGYKTNNLTLIVVGAICGMVFSLTFTYWVADSALPDWFKFWLLR